MASLKNMVTLPINEITHSIVKKFATKNMALENLKRTTKGSWEETEYEVS
jgi:hypothetical protein